jgi:hypothetical protein
MYRMEKYTKNLWKNIIIKKYITHLIVSCALWNQEVETSVHIAVTCVFSKEVWVRVFGVFWLSSAGANVPMWIGVVVGAGQEECCTSATEGFQLGGSPGGLVVWLECNERIFRGTRRQPCQVIASILTDLESWCNAKLVDRSCLAGM